MIGTLFGAAVLIVVGYVVGTRRGRGTERALTKTLGERDEELVSARNEIQRLGSRDALTGLTNEQYLERSWSVSGGGPSGIRLRSRSS